LTAEGERERVVLLADPPAGDTGPEGASPFDELPEEVLLGVLACLACPRAVGRAAQVCRRWRGVALAEPLWAYICRHNLTVHPAPQGTAPGLEDPMAVGLVRCAPPLPAVATAGSWREHLLTRLLGTFDDMATASPPPGQNYGHLFKFLMLGPGGAGKTSFMTRFHKAQFSEAWITTFGIDYMTKAVALKGHVIMLQLWDTPGTAAGRFQATVRSVIARASWRGGAGGIFIMFDVSYRSQFEELAYYFEIAEATALDAADGDGCLYGCPILLVGCKNDLRGRGGEHPAGSQPQDAAVTFAEAEELAQLHGVQYIECNARDGDGVEQAVHALTSAALKEAAGNPATPPQPPPPQPPDSSKCLVQ
jgi:GTPase SAR1 family protein